LDNILEVKDLSRSFPDFQLNKISFSLPRGYVMGFVGPNGSGKTTTIKLIMNLTKRDSGQISVFGLDNRAKERDIKQRIGFVYDENHFYDTLTLEEMKRVVAPFYHSWDEALYRRYINEFNLPVKKKIQDLSRGMKMKFSLALALSHRAELILMDEPTSGLDPVFRAELLDILQSEMQDEKRGILFSSHITSDLERIADYICFINNGQIVLSDTRDNVIDKYVLVKGSRDQLDDAVKPLFVSIRENDFGFEGLSDQPGTIRGLLGNRALYEKPKLDDIILYTVRRDRHAAVN
jgi:ABC-2 type transport system ATP-binding protein